MTETPLQQAELRSFITYFWAVGLGEFIELS